MGFWSGFWIGVTIGTIVGSVGIVIIALMVSKSNDVYKPSNYLKYGDYDRENEEVNEEI